MGSIFKRKSHRTGKAMQNYSIRYFNQEGVRVTETTHTSDKRVAERILRKKEADVALVTGGVVDPLEERYRAESSRPVHEHLEDYLAACRDKQAASGFRHKERHLRWLLEATQALALTDIRPDVLDVRLSALSEGGLGARSINIRLECANAFLNWCVKNGRLRSNPLKVVPRRNEVMGRRRERRPLSREECQRLIAVAREQALNVPGATGRPLWYLLPLRAGLRRGDLERLTWGAVDLLKPSLTIRGGKARSRIDRLPLTRELVDELRRYKPTTALPSARVFPRPVSNETRKQDFQRAGIPLINDRDEHADLHSLRVTFGTELALQGVPPAVHKQLMRHSTVELTMKYYTKLGLDDLEQRGLDLLPPIEGPIGDGLGGHREAL